MGRRPSSSKRSSATPHGSGSRLRSPADSRSRAGCAASVTSSIPMATLDRARELLGEGLDAVADRGMPPPNVDVALAALTFCADMPPGSGEAAFALARTAGWIAHALEQYEQPTFMRARVDYVGPRPA